MSRSYGVYAHLCTECNHLSSVHLLAEEGDLRAGPYVCRKCSCSQPQDGPFEAMTRSEFERWEQQQS